MKLNQAILPVAGFGTRFLPWTKVVPKELLPIGNVPIIALLVDECMSVGIHDICFVISQGKEAIPQYFYEHPELEEQLEARGKSHMLEELNKYDNVNFHVVYQREMKGDGHAILQAEDWIKSDTLAILFGDDIIVGKENGLQQLVRAMGDVSKGRPSSLHSSGQAMLCLQDVPKERVSTYGIVDIDDEKTMEKSHIKKIKGLVEKPKPEVAPSTLGIVGKYIIPKDIIGELKKIQAGGHDGEIRLIDGLISKVGSMDIYGCVFEGTRYDTGTPDGYKQAVKDLG